MVGVSIVSIEYYPSLVQTAISMSDIPPQFDLESYAYELPEERIAQFPADRRDSSRLLVLDRTSGSLDEASFSDLPRFLPPGALLVANNSKVLPARLEGRKPTGGRVEFLLLTPLPRLQAALVGQDTFQAEAEGLLKASKGFKPGDTASLAQGLDLEVLDAGEFGRCRVLLRWQGDLARIFQEHGHMPLPPYIRRPDSPDDAGRYQAVYASDERLGSVAAPTAGLHFTPELRRGLAAAGFGWAEATLYVGYGTFSPIRCRDIRDHAMHEEYVEIPESTALAVARARDQGRPVACVGTTSVRTLEGAYAAMGAPGPFQGFTSLYIMPGFRFRAADVLLTNFHLPRSSLLVMLAAFAGRERVLRAYQEALDRGFRFFSYGDAMLIL